MYEADTGRVLQVMATGDVEETPHDVARAERMLVRYLGEDQSTWSTTPDDYPGYLRNGGPPGLVWLKLNAPKILSFNFSYSLVFGE